MRAASRVFLGIGLFGLVADLVFATGNHFRNPQGIAILGFFVVASMFLSYFLLRESRHDVDGFVVPVDPDEEIHLPGPSWWPAGYGVSGLVLVLGLVFHHTLLLAGVALLVLTSIGWGVESVRDYRRELAHEKPGPPAPDRVAVEAAHAILGFRHLHGGADAVVQHIGRGRGEIVLVGPDGGWGILEVRDVAAGRAACALAGTTLHDTWPQGLGARVRTSVEDWRRMGGTSPFSAPTHPAPRDGNTQVPAKVFLTLAIFAVLAASLFVSGWHSKSALEGGAILTAFGVANFYLFLALRAAKGTPEDMAYAGPDLVTVEPSEPDPPIDLETLHLPGPSWWPALFAVAAFLLVFGLVFVRTLLLVGVVGIAACAVGWATESVREYRASISHGGH